MTYPAIILVAIFIIGALMLIYVVPTLTGTFKELKVELPASTKFIIFISDLLVNNTVTGILGTCRFYNFFSLSACEPPAGRNILTLSFCGFLLSAIW